MKITKNLEKPSVCWETVSLSNFYLRFLKRE